MLKHHIFPFIIHIIIIYIFSIYASYFIRPVCKIISIIQYLIVISII